MRIEHFGYQVADPKAVADWYCRHMGFVIRRVNPGGANAHFLADESGQAMIEIYHNSAIDVPDYASMDPLTIHLAFACDDVAATVSRLQDAGATVVEPATVTGRGDVLAMMRDPWGLAVQLCRRAEPMTGD